MLGGVRGEGGRGGGGEEIHARDGGGQADEAQQPAQSEGGEDALRGEEGPHDGDGGVSEQGGHREQREGEGNWMLLDGSAHWILNFRNMDLFDIVQVVVLYRLNQQKSITDYYKKNIAI